ncbi:hypothetical protein Pdw03_4654 [Penicillium digitatum]|uniref:Uncharacterized protein n=3 Tax=Penicillium digitatum TaxID=36651 RepID=K9FP19_PEND2|nr:hypothetical protein PDIP_67770 [Penicillium digitatum Pd1]EKV08485.1 hypothetical protein PDIP_67770 [Penicillium digitatum Pd1]EKV10137.1 hypothetical protein PDIG_58280 [Penicillium digitatum PHI26]KAG0158711.1 hypothetical protein PDIDSM_6230 [Penicillium digitatum]QQK41800.1 hypothetical protein Pdw03_4654 [Penicillium digitatum]
MAPAIREVTQTLIEADTTLVTVITLGYTRPWPTLDLVTLTVTTPFTTVIHVVDIAATPAPEQINAAPSSGLSDGSKGAIAGSILGVVVFLLLLYYLYLCRLQSRAMTSRSVKVPLDAQDPTSPPDPVPTDDKPARKTKTVTMSPDLPRHLPPFSASKDAKLYISHLVRLSTETNSRTGFETREGRLGQRIRFMIRTREKHKPRKKRRRSHRHRSKRKSAKKDTKE